ncbi:MAG: glycosyltransferase [Deltaproteobacteria bacterium]|nr:glycosyltransferase [Deltaproteobacteria bacterium]MBW2497425.1 glycosyltransferase [Deltaproteobacteria bacterium]
MCQQVGGIYQVLRSKAQAMRARWDGQYVLIGPLVPRLMELEIEPEPASDWLAEPIKLLQEQGRDVVHGLWLVAGRPRVILVDPVMPPERIEVVRHRLHRDFGIPPARGNELVDSVIGFGDAVHQLLELVASHANDRRLIAHFHEWLGALALPMIEQAELPYATLFTTHATSVGRYVASSGEDLYDSMPTLDPDREAERFGIESQHAIERVCATKANAFTTVSPITGEECARLLDRTPDFVTPNGLDLARFEVGENFQTLHTQYKEQIHRFVMGHFFPSYSFDLDKTLYFFNAGRFEPRNKGFDLCLEAMSRLNAELRANESEQTVIFFIITARSARSLEPRALHARGILDDLDEVAQRIGRELGERLFRSSAAGNVPPLEEMVQEYWWLRHRRLQQAFGSSDSPLVCTHVLDDAENDPILGHLRHLGLHNSAEDRVKVVYHPDFISPVNPLWSMDYEHFVRGCHLGVFPSCYEPWGYTPLECLAVGVPAITSDLAGFGRYVQEVFPDHNDWGLDILPRRGNRYHDAAADLTERILAFCGLDRQGRIALRNQVALHSKAFDWSRLVGAYHEAHDRALLERFGA